MLCNEPLTKVEAKPFFPLLGLSFAFGGLGGFGGFGFPFYRRLCKNSNGVYTSCSRRKRSVDSGLSVDSNEIPLEDFELQGFEPETNPTKESEGLGSNQIPMESSVGFEPVENPMWKAADEVDQNPIEALTGFEPVISMDYMPEVVASSYNFYTIRHNRNPNNDKDIVESRI